MTTDVLIIFPPVERMHIFDIIILPSSILPATLLDRAFISTSVLNANFLGLRSIYPSIFSRFDKSETYVKKKWKNLEHYLKKLQPEIVFIDTRYQVLSSLSLTFKKIKQIANSKVCVYGPVTTYAIHLLKNKNVDFVINDEPEYTILELSKALIRGDKKFNKIDGLAYREKNKIIFTKPRKLEFNLDRFPIPDRTLVLDYKKYPSYGLGVIEISRGCPYNCLFCSRYLQKPLRFRNPKNIIREIMEIYTKFGTRIFSFEGSSISNSKKWVLELCRLIREKKLKIFFGAYSRADTLNEEIIKEMKMAGCYEISLGLESGSQRMLNLMNKELSLEKSKNTINLLKKYKISCSTSFILGYPGETIEDVNQTLKFISETKPSYFVLSFFVPVKSSLIFPSLARNNLIKLPPSKYSASHPNLIYNKNYLNYIKRFYNNYKRVGEKLKTIDKLKKSFNLKFMFARISEIFNPSH